MEEVKYIHCSACFELSVSRVCDIVLHSCFSLSCLFWSINPRLEWSGSICFSLLTCSSFWFTSLSLSALIYHIYCLVELYVLNSPVQPSTACSRPVQFLSCKRSRAQPQAHPLFLLAQSPGKQHVWRSGIQTGSSLAQAAVNYIKETQECHTLHSPGPGSACCTMPGLTYHSDRAHIPTETSVCVCVSSIVQGPLLL